jgi:hypothetical protein
VCASSDHKCAGAIRHKAWPIIGSFLRVLQKLATLHRKVQFTVGRKRLHDTPFNRILTSLKNAARFFGLTRKQPERTQFYDYGVTLHVTNMGRYCDSAYTYITHILVEVLYILCVLSLKQCLFMSCRLVTVHHTATDC